MERVESSDWQTILFFTCVVEGLVLGRNRVACVEIVNNNKRDPTDVPDGLWTALLVVQRFWAEQFWNDVTKHLWCYGGRFYCSFFTSVVEPLCKVILLGKLSLCFASTLACTSPAFTLLGSFYAKLPRTSNQNARCNRCIRRVY